MVSGIQHLEGRKGLVAHVFFADIDLQSVAAVAQVGENALAHVAHGGQAAGRLDGLIFLEGGPDFGQSAATFEEAAERRVTGRGQLFHVSYALFPVFVARAFHTVSRPLSPLRR